MVRRTWTLATALAATAVLAMTAVAPALADVAATQTFDFVTVNFTLKGKKSGKLAIKLTRGNRAYARGTIARARPGRNKVRCNAIRSLSAGKYTLRWTFTPTSGKASSGKSIVDVE
jgi:methionine-rich copper-binding protein CopC